MLQFKYLKFIAVQLYLSKTCREGDHKRYSFLNNISLFIILSFKLLIVWLFIQGLLYSRNCPPCEIWSRSKQSLCFHRALSSRGHGDWASHFTDTQCQKWEKKQKQWVSTMVPDLIQERGQIPGQGVMCKRNVKNKQNFHQMGQHVGCLPVRKRMQSGELCWKVETERNKSDARESTGTKIHEALQVMLGIQVRILKVMEIMLDFKVT